jgi:hypothetical protein
MTKERPATKNTVLQNRLGRAAVLSAAALLSFSVAAQAAFEWRGPLEQPAPGAAPQASADEFGALGPVTGNPPPAMPPARVQPVETVSMPAPIAPVPVAPARMPASAPQDTAPPADAVEGFGRDVPLAIALQQIVPPGYQYSFAPGVDAGEMVTWSGGRAWHDVLSDALAQSNLGYRVDGNIVTIDHADKIPAAAPAAPQPAPMQSLKIANVAQPEEDAPITIRRDQDGSLRRAVSSFKNSIGWTSPAAPDAQPVAVAPAAAAAPVSMPPAPSLVEAPVPLLAAPAAAPAPVSVPPAPNMLEGDENFVMPASDRKVAAGDTMNADWDTQDAQGNDGNISWMDHAPVETANAPVSVAPQPVPVRTEEIRRQKPSSLWGRGQATADAPQPAPVPAPVPVAVAPDAAPAAPAVAQAAWQAGKGATLRDTLKAWSDKAGVTLYWSSDYDYRVAEDTAFDGSYNDAVARLLDRYAGVSPRPYAQLYTGTGAGVLVVRAE